MFRKLVRLDTDTTEVQLEVKVTKENAATMIGMTSNKGFLVSIILCYIQISIIIFCLRPHTLNF